MEVDADVVVVCGCGGCGGISYIYMALLFWNDQLFVRLTRLTVSMLLCVYAFVWVNSIEQYNKCRWPVWWIRRRLEYLLDVGGCLLVRRILSEMVCYSLAIALYTVCNNVCYRQLRSLEKNDTIGPITEKVCAGFAVLDHRELTIISPVKKPQLFEDP